MAEMSDRQKRIMEHVSRSKGDFIKTPIYSEQRQQQIREHIRLSQGK